MDDHRTSRERFRRSWLTTTPEWAVAGSVSLAIGLAAQHFGLQGGWEGAALMGLPLIWAGGRTLQWLCHTWTLTADGCLTVRKGVLFPTYQVIHLCSVSQVTADAPSAIRWLDTGHICVEATDHHGLRRHFRWTWMHGHDRLCGIIRARGRLPIDGPTMSQTPRERATQRVGATLRGVVCAPSRADLQDYGRFVAFCHHILRAEESGRWSLGATPPATAERWMAVLRSARVLVDASNKRGWRVAGGIDCLDDICSRLGPDELQRAIQQSTRFQ